MSLKPASADHAGDSAPPEIAAADSDTMPLPPPQEGAGGHLASNGSQKATSHRDDVVIPDFTLIKRVGAGAYGEVWLAQGVTGALRAVKIVWREDFELTKTFHREFLGIQQFEPISRGHPGLVHILHVGWNEQRGFYYCVMELADDCEAGPHITDTRSYVPRTLGTDMKQHGRLDLHFVIEAGIFLADALHYMHQHGLTHRDIKPSNIIFAGGVCKLADIGLVAGFGERTFVGTEGFVPPEGPGTPQADIYSLGKVLYEMSSGKDRMEFPDIPDDLGEEEWPVWKDLNRTICKACAPDLKERFATATEFAEALRKVAAPKPETIIRKASRMAKAAAILIFTSAFAGGVLAGFKIGQDESRWTMTAPLPARQPRKPEPPADGKPWQNRLGQWFTFKDGKHVADLPVDHPSYFRFVLDTKGAMEGDFAPMTVPGVKEFRAVLVPPDDAAAFCNWMTATERKSGRLTIDHEYAWRPVKVPPSAGVPPPRDPRLTAFRCEIVRVFYGSLSIDSTPQGAEVLQDTLLMGRTPLALPKVRAGDYAFSVQLPGYAAELVKGRLTEGQSSSYNLRLKANGAVVFGKPWQNGLGMKFVPLGDAMLAVHETRRGDFAKFAEAAKLPPLPGRVLDKDLNLPATFLSRLEAEAFCLWLTETERKKGLLEARHGYRLLSDDEWSMAAYLTPEAGASPSEKNLKIGSIYPWGFTWPPLPKPGNLFDKTAATKDNPGIADYDDGFALLAPVSSFRPDARGVADLAGNVWEWVADSWGGSDPATQRHGVVRGGSYLTKERTELVASFRKPLPADTRAPDIGFRIILTEDGKPARESEQAD